MLRRRRQRLLSLTRSVEQKERTTEPVAIWRTHVSTGLTVEIHISLSVVDSFSLFGILLIKDHENGL